VFRVFRVSVRAAGSELVSRGWNARSKALPVLGLGGRHVHRQRSVTLRTMSGMFTRGLRRRRHTLCPVCPPAASAMSHRGPSPVPARVGHSHVLHGSQWTLSSLRQRTTHFFAWSERSRREAATVMDSAKIVYARSSSAEQYVVGFSGAHPELVDIDGLHILAIGMDNGHLQTGDADVEDVIAPALMNLSRSRSP